MDDTRLERLRRLLGGTLPERATTAVLKGNTTQPGIPTHDMEGLTNNDGANPRDEPYRAPLGAGPLIKRAPVARQPIRTFVQPAFIPSLPTKGELDINTDPRCGQPAPYGLQFCPFLAITKLPYKFIEPQFKQPVASAFFDAEKIWNREWDLYYVWSEDAPTLRPVTFVAATQVQGLIDEVNAAFPDLKWTFTDQHEAKGLLIDFTSSRANLRPRWLGHSNSRERHELLQDSVDAPHRKAEGAAAPELISFREDIELAVALPKNRSKGSRSRAKSADAGDLTMVKRNASEIQLEHAFQYLGLTRGASGSTPESAQATSVPEVIFIAIDIEAFERAQHKITEVGIATLDTRDLRELAMGRVGSEWHKAIRARHFIVREHRHLVNKKFVQGCPDKFEFGTSEVVPLGDLPKVLTSCFHPPYSKASEGSVTSEERKVVLVGHDIGGDIKYCHQIGFSVLNRSCLVEVLDTLKMDRAITKDRKHRGLGTILSDLDLDAWYRHNAGNDAVYTLWAMLGMCCGGVLKQEVPTEEATVAKE